MTTQVDHHVHDQLSHPSFQVRILVRFLRRRSIAYRWHDVPQLFATVPMLGAKIFSLAGQVSTRVPNEGRPRHRIWTNPDEGISSPFGLVSVSAFSAVGMMEVLQSHGRCGTPRKALTTAPPMSVLFNPCRRRPELPRPWGASSDDQDSCIPARERIVGRSIKLTSGNGVPDARRGDMLQGSRQAQHWHLAGDRPLALGPPSTLSGLGRVLAVGSGHGGWKQKWCS